jgi:hypothetical protein
MITQSYLNRDLKLRFAEDNEIIVGLIAAVRFPPAQSDITQQ